MAALRKSPHSPANTVSDAEALKLVMEMMAIPGRSGEEAAIMDFIRGKLAEAGIPSANLTFDDAHRHNVLTILKSQSVPGHWIQMIEEITELAADEQSQMLGDSLPIGLRLLLGDGERGG